MDLNEKLSAVTLRDILSFGIANIPLGDDKLWSVNSRKWMVDLYKVVNPYWIEKKPIGQPKTFVCTKSTQAGVTTMALVRLLHFMTHWTGKIMYMMPRQKDVLDLVGTRLDPMLDASPMLSKLRGTPDNMQTKKIGNSFVYFQEGTMEPRSIPIDLLFVDEVDLTDPANIGTATNRLDASSWALRYYLSTPTINNYGIHKMWLASDMRKWLVKCPKCGAEQEIKWDENLVVKGDPADPDDVYYTCSRCRDSRLTIPHIQTGRWVPMKPDRSDTTVGFHVHQMLTTPADILYAQYRDPLESEVEFHRKRLGMPFEIGGGSLDSDEIKAACWLDAPYDVELRHDGISRYFCGIDQGNQLQCVIAKLEPGSEIPKIVRVELIEQEKGFSRVAQLMRFFRIQKCVLDANPNRHSSVAIAADFPGRIYVSYYNESVVWYTTKKKYIGDKPYFQAYIDRTMGFDDLIQKIRNGQWGIYGDLGSLPQDVYTLLDQTTALKRDTEERVRGGIKIEVPVYRSTRADHLGHAWSYLNVAVNMGRLASGRIAIVSEKNREDETEDFENSLREGITDEEYREIMYHLAEVSHDELQAWINGEQKSVVLQIKLGFLPEYPEDKIKQVVTLYLLTNKN